MAGLYVLCYRSIRGDATMIYHVWRNNLMSLLGSFGGCKVLKSTHLHRRVMNMQYCGRGHQPTTPPRTSMSVIPMLQPSITSFLSKRETRSFPSLYIIYSVRFILFIHGIYARSTFLLFHKNVECISPHSP